MKPIIEVEDISKRYTIGKKESYGSLRDEIMQALASPFKRRGRGDGGADAEDNTVWALKDVSFKVEEGEVLGIIGRNGAGKSTLLKILSRITEPTEGRIRMRGRVASLLEVGTGFHPELTGRENIFLNGALLGMTSAEIRQKFDEIVAFSEIEKFLDTPVKRYSSGMYVRLAFAVAAHLEPEILVIDEVLAVGDAGFQKKCLGKMGDVAKGGRTVLFVSHNMAAVKKLCSKAILLKQGHMIENSTTEDVIERYLGATEPEPGVGPVVIKKDLNVKTKVNFKVDGITVSTSEGKPISVLKTGDAIKLRVDFTAGEKIISAALMISCKTQHGVEVFRLSTMPISGYPVEYIQGKGFFDLNISELPLLGGSYDFDIALARENVEWYFIIQGAVSLNVEPTDVYGSGLALDNHRGLISVKHTWQHKCAGYTSN